jgi:transposase
MAHKRGRDRSEVRLLPAALDDYVSKDNPVRLIDALVESLDLGSLGYGKVNPEKTGRPPYAPSDLLKLFIYGYMHKVPTSRRLERQSRCNVEVMWLLGELMPDFKTIARFRSENAEAIEKTFEMFIKASLKQEFFGRTLAAIDGSRFKGVNSIGRVYDQSGLEKAIKRTKKKLQDYMHQMDELDQQEEEVEQITEAELNEKIKKMKEEVKKLQEAEKKLKTSGQTQIAITDPDCRRMKVGSRAMAGYNVQVAVDKKNKLIAAFKVTNDRADFNNLFEIALKTKRHLDVEKLSVLTDTGYYDCDEVYKCHQEGITTFINSPASKLGQNKFSKAKFIYNPQKDVYQCPAGKTMKFLHTVNKGDGRLLRAYGTKACLSCDLKLKCTASKIGRLVQRYPNEHVMDAMAERVKKNPNLMRQRKAIIEHIFGCIKSSMNLREFLTKGFKNVRAEFSLAALAFNLKRLLNLVGTEKLIAALT